MNHLERQVVRKTHPSFQTKIGWSPSTDTLRTFLHPVCTPDFCLCYSKNHALLTLKTLGELFNWVDFYKDCFQLDKNGPPTAADSTICGSVEGHEPLHIHDSSLIWHDTF